ncbi:ATP-binding cassette domain-containing protein [Sphingomonas sp.]|uniref:ATP-binding cassette domain-containing protein n=1 Tax=Sphingomonas sp. TaxID=28214 RepID=UPI003B3A84B7
MSSEPPTFDIDVTVRRGDAHFDTAFTAGPGLTALFGPSGAGKTSLLDMVAGLLRPDRGRIVVAGETLFGDGVDLPPERRRAGYVFQDARLFPHMNVRANLRYGRRPGTLPFDDVVDLLGLSALLGRAPATLSGGEAQRVGIGRALLSGPRFLLMDEPLSSLDAARAEEIMGMIERVRDDLRLPILYVSHNRAEVDRLATRVIPIAR